MGEGDQGGTSGGQTTAKAQPEYDYKVLVQPATAQPGEGADAARYHWTELAKTYRAPTREAAEDAAFADIIAKRQEPEGEEPMELRLQAVLAKRWDPSTLGEEEVPASRKVVRR